MRVQVVCVPLTMGPYVQRFPRACKINVLGAAVSDPLPQPSMGSAAFPEHLDHSEDGDLVSLPDPWKQSVLSPKPVCRGPGIERGRVWLHRLFFSE